jgi:hypothetical protein
MSEETAGCPRARPERSRTWDSAPVDPPAQPLSTLGGASPVTSPPKLNTSFNIRELINRQRPARFFVHPFPAFAENNLPRAHNWNTEDERSNSGIPGDRFPSLGRVKPRCAAGCKTMKNTAISHAVSPVTQIIPVTSGQDGRLGFFPVKLWRQLNQSRINALLRPIPQEPTKL